MINQSIIEIENKLIDNLIDKSVDKSVDKLSDTEILLKIEKEIEIKKKQSLDLEKYYHKPIKIIPQDYLISSEIQYFIDENDNDINFEFIK